MIGKLKTHVLRYQAWVTARSEKDFSKFAPVLEEWVALVRESSQLVDPSRPAYDVALEEFEKGMTAARLDEVFTQVPLLTPCDPAFQ